MNGVGHRNLKGVQALVRARVIEEEQRGGRGGRVQGVREARIGVEDEDMMVNEQVAIAVVPVE